MHFYFYFQFLLSLHVCLSQVRRPDAASVMPFAPATPPQPAKCANKSATAAPKNALRFRVPFMDMNIQNERNLLLIQERTKNQLFILHGNELYVLIVSRDEKRLSLIGLLGGGVRQSEPIGAEIIAWRKYLLLVIALEEYLEIYQLNAVLLAQNAEATKSGQVSRDTITNFEPIQQLTWNGRFRKLFLFNADAERVMLLTAVNYTKLQSKLRTYEWSNTFFATVEDLTIPAIHMMEVIGTGPIYLLSGRLIKHQGRTIIVVYEIDANDLHLRNRQTLTIPARTVHAYTFRGRNYLIGCASQQQKCSTYRMKRDEGQFTVFRQFNGKELTFERFVGGKYFLVGTHQRALNVYPNARMDCYASFSANESDVSEIMTHVSQQDESFVLLNYRRPFNTLLRMFEVETADGERLGASAPATLNDTGVEDLSALQEHQHLFEGTVQRLRSLLLQRKTAMDVFRKAAAILRPKLQKLKAPHAVRLHAGNIGIVRIMGDALQSPIQLIQRVQSLRAPTRSARFMRATPQQPGFVLEIPSVAKVQRLEVGNLLYNGSLLPGFYLNNGSSTGLPILSIRSAIRTKVLSTPQLLTRQSFRQPRENTRSAPNIPLQVRNLSVERINNVSVAEFFNSIFLRNRDSKLKGSLILQGATKVDTLNTTSLNDLKVAQLFNLKEPQVVHTKMFIHSVTVGDVQADSVNGLNFTEDVAFSGRDDLIEGPVELKKMRVAGDLLVGYKPKKERDIDDEDSQFQQFYTGKVIITGSLTVDNVGRDNPFATAVFVNGLPFTESMLRDVYLLQNTPQDIHTPVKFGNAKITTPQFATNWLNGHPTLQHLLTTGHPPLQMPLLLIFMLANIDGDVICQAYKSKLLELSEDVVRYGDTANITGWKFFHAPLTIEHLTTNKLNNFSANELVLKSELQREFRFFGNKSFDKLVVTQQAHVKEALNYAFLNDAHEDETLRRDQYFKQLHLPYRLQASNIVIHKINGIAFDKIFDRLKVENEQLVLHKDLVVDGNVQFAENLQVETVNDILWSQYVTSLVRINENAVINGTTVFMTGLTVKNKLLTTGLNGNDMREVFSNVLLKSKAQEITGNYTFGNLRLTNLDVSIINNVPTSTFLDTRAKELTIQSDLIIPKLTVQGDLNGNFASSLNFDTLNEQLKQLPQKRWRNVVVHGNAYWNESSAGSPKQYEQLQYLHRQAVRRDGDQLISGTVQMSQPLISRMRTRTQFPNGVDLSYIAGDCLLKNTTVPQTIAGGKLFHKTLRLQSAIVSGSLRIELLNTIDVQRFHDSLYRPSREIPIEGPLYFKIPPIVGQLLVQGTVNGKTTAQIYTSSQGVMPPVKVHSLVVEDALQIGDVNDVSLNYMLMNRVRLNGEPQDVQGFLTFENLSLNNETLLQSINGIAIDDMIFKKSAHVQVIDGQTVIDGNLIFNGPAHVLNFNGERLLDMVKQTIFTMGSYHFDNLTLDKGEFMKGLVLVRNMRMEDIERTLPTDVEHTEAEHTSQEEQEIEDMQTDYRAQLTDVVEELSNLSANANNSSRQHLLYLDFDYKIEVLRQYANESVNETYLMNLQHISVCEHRLLQVQYAQESQRLFIANLTTSSLMARHGEVWARAQNHCDRRPHKIKSRITVNGRVVSKLFGMRKYIESMQFFNGSEGKLYLLLHAIDRHRGRNEVRLVRVDDEGNEVVDLQTIAFGIGNTMHVFKLRNLTALASSSWMDKQSAVSIYHFEPVKEHFRLAQVIDGPFDVMELVEVQTERYQMLLSCVKCHSINVFELKTDPVISYKPFQIIKLPMRIDKFHTFTMGDGELFLLTLGEHQADFYHLYKFVAIQGWLQNAVGLFPRIELAVPLAGKLLQSNGGGLVLLLCGGIETDRCSIVRPYIQQ